jgi:hypothetical protein
MANVNYIPIQRVVASTKKGCMERFFFLLCDIKIASQKYKKKCKLFHFYFISTYIISFPPTARKSVVLHLGKTTVAQVKEEETKK